MSNCKEYDDLFPRSVNDAVRNFKIREDFSLASALQEHEINKYYTENKYRNALMRIDYPKALDEQQKENENAKYEKERKQSMERRRERVDEELAKKLEKELRIERKLKEEKKTDFYLNLPRELEQHTPEKQKQQDPRQNAESYDVIAACTEGRVHDESAALQALRLLDWDSLASVKKLEQEKRDQELAKKIQLLETSPELTQEEVDKKLAMEAQDEEVARMLYSREKAKLKKAREKARIKKEMNKQLDAEHTAESCHKNEPSFSLSNDKTIQQQGTIDTRISDNIYIDPFDIKDTVFGSKNQSRGSTPEYNNKKTSNDQNVIFQRDKNDDFPPYMPIQGSRRPPLDISKKKKTNALSNSLLYRHLLNNFHDFFHGRTLKI